MKVILFPQYALVLVRAAIADIWWFTKFVTELLLVILAQLVAKIASGAKPRAVELVAAKIASLATIAFHAPIVDAAWRILITGCGTGANLSGNS